MTPLEQLALDWAEARRAAIASAESGGDSFRACLITLANAEAALMQGAAERMRLTTGSYVMATYVMGELVEVTRDEARRLLLRMLLLHRKQPTWPVGHLLDVAQFLINEELLDARN